MSRTTHATLRLATPDQASALDSSARAHLAVRYLHQLHTIALELYDHTLYREASDLCRYLTLVEPTNPSHWYWLGRALVALGDPAAAGHVFELGGRMSHRSHFADLAADAWLRAGHPERAEAATNLKGPVT